MRKGLLGKIAIAPESSDHLAGGRAPRPRPIRMKFLNLQRWWMKKYISAAMISNASKKRTTFQLPLVSGVIGELAIVALLKSALAVFAFTNFKSSILVSSSCTEPSGMAVAAFRFT